MAIDLVKHLSFPKPEDSVDGETLWWLYDSNGIEHVTLVATTRTTILVPYL